MAAPPPSSRFTHHVPRTTHPVFHFTLHVSGLTLPRVSKKSAKIAALIERCRGGELDPHYLGYFECFNRQLFYEAHEVLEELWLTSRRGPNDSFCKVLIQLAGAFVHLQKERLQPAAALFNLARANLEHYPGRHLRLDVARVLALIDDWRGGLEARNRRVTPLIGTNAPQLVLLDDSEDCETGDATR